jgi:hypothetical protein
VAPVPAADGKAGYPFSGWGLTFEVDGPLPDLPDHAPAWRVDGPVLDRAAVTRIAGALGLAGEPVQRDGGWLVASGDWSFSAFDNGGTWSVNLYRANYDRRPDDTPAGPAISPADAERRVRDLLDRMGAPSASWTAETTGTQIGAVWGCAEATPPPSPEELTKLEADKLRQIEQENPTTAAPSVAPAKPAAGSGEASSCPPPPPAVNGFNVALFPVLDGRRAEWAAWNVTLRSDGRIENLYGSWVSFARRGDYKLRGVNVALQELQSPPQAMPLYAVDMPAAAPAAPVMPAYAVDMPAAAPAAPVMPAEDAAGAGASGGSTGSDPARPPADMVPPVPSAPQVVKVTGVALGLTPTSVFEDGEVRMALVPAYTFSGHFAGSDSPWQTSVIALHPDAIAPPPDVPPTTSGVTGIGKALPPVPAPTPAPMPEPAIARD